MTCEERLLEYEIQIKDMLRVLQLQLDEFKDKSLDDFERGRELAYFEILDIIKTRYQLIQELISDG